jgi:hypothetical protein
VFSLVAQNTYEKTLIGAGRTIKAQKTHFEHLARNVQCHGSWHHCPCSAINAIAAAIAAAIPTTITSSTQADHTNFASRHPTETENREFTNLHKVVTHRQRVRETFKKLKKTKAQRKRLHSAKWWQQKREFWVTRMRNGAMGLDGMEWEVVFFYYLLKDSTGQKGARLLSYYSATSRTWYFDKYIHISKVSLHDHKTWPELPLSSMPAT